MAQDPVVHDGFVLWPREAEFIRGVVKGLGYKQIAALMGISYNTVHRHAQRVYDKLNLHDRVSLAMWAVRTGFVSPGETQ